MRPLLTPPPPPQSSAFYFCIVTSDSFKTTSNGAYLDVAYLEDFDNDGGPVDVTYAESKLYIELQCQVGCNYCFSGCSFKGTEIVIQTNLKPQIAHFLATSYHLHPRSRTVTRTRRYSGTSTGSSTQLRTLSSPGNAVPFREYNYCKNTSNIDDFMIIDHRI